MMLRQPRQQQEEEEEEEAQKNKGEKVESDFDPKTMRKTKPGLKRLYLTLSLLFSFILGFPLVWKSVEIYRSRLPYDEIDALSKQLKSKRPPLFPSSHFHAIFLDYSSSSSSITNLNADDLQRSIVAKITKLTASQNYQCECGTLHRNFTLSVTTVDDSSSDDDDDDDASVGGCTHSGGSSCLYESQCGAIRTFDFELFDDDAAVVDDAMESALGGGRQCLGSAYTVVVVVVNNTVVDAVDDEVRAVVGKYRHAWFVVGKGLLEMGMESLLDKVAEVFVKVFVNGGREDGLIHRGEFMPVGADGSIVLSFNLLNANPRDWIYDWDFERIEKTLLAPVIEALRPIASISVESQVLYHTPKSSFSSWDEKLGSYIFSTKELPFFVNSNEWHLDTSIAAGGQSKILQFVIYIPSAKECPLLLQLPDGELSMTNGFISPMWGGVMVWNPKTCLMDSDNKLPNRHIISPQDLQMIFEVFLGQFRQLFGLKSDSTYVGASGTYDLLASERGFTEWELDVLARQHLCFNLHSSATTLESLSRLVQSLPRMIIMDEIGKQVQFSLEAAKSAQGNASLGVYDASAVSSRQARSMAEDAFFHPSIMSVSYHSFEHCFAVYSPFFLPISMHVLLAAVRECRRYKIEKSKYLLWKAETKVGS